VVAGQTGKRQQSTGSQVTKKQHRWEREEEGNVRTAARAHEREGKVLTISVNQKRGLIHRGVKQTETGQNGGTNIRRWERETSFGTTRQRHKKGKREKNLCGYVHSGIRCPSGG